MNKIISYQVRFTLKQKPALISFYLLLTVILLNFTSNVLAFQGSDVVEMFHPAKMLTLSYNRVYYNADITLLLVQLYPALVACPAGFLLASERNRKTDLLLITRIGGRRYFLCKLLVAFLTTMVVFTVPFFVELALNCVSFPLRATGDFTYNGQYDPEYATMVENYLFPWLFRQSPYLYAVAGILLFGVFSGVMGMLTTALSAVVKVRYKIVLFLPTFLLLNGTLYLSEAAASEASARWFDYVLLFSDMPKNGKFFAVALLVLAAASLFCGLYRSGGDQL